VVEYNQADDSAIKNQWVSEVYQLIQDPEKTLLIEWKDDTQKWLIDYRSLFQYTQKMYLTASHFDIIPTNDEVETYTSEQGVVNLINAEYQRKFKLEIDYAPRWIIDELALIIRHKFFYINGKRFTPIISSYSVARVENTMMFTASIEVVEYDLAGIYSGNYEWENMAILPDPPAPYLLIDDKGHKLKIDSTHFERI
jgi:hypothetical protein